MNTKKHTLKSKALKTASAIIAATVMTGCLAGCGVSKSDFEKLEKRVAQLESQIDNSSEKSSSSSSSKSSGSASSSKNTDNSNSSSSSSSSDSKFDESKVSKEIEVEQHDYLDDDGNKFSIFVFENDSDFNVDAEIKITTKDKNNKVLQEEEKTIKGLPKDKEAYASFSLDPDTETIVRTVTYTENTAKENPLAGLTAKATKAEGGANVTIRNSGTSEVKGLKYMTLFFEDDELVGFDNGDIPNIPAGSSEVIPSVFYSNFDKAEVYFTLEK